MSTWADPDNFKRGALGPRIKQKPRKVGLVDGLKRQTP